MARPRRAQARAGPRRLIAQLTDPIVVRKILAHLGHPTEPPRPAPARSREQFNFA